MKKLIMILLLVPKSLFALSGKDINSHIKNWLSSKGFKSNPQYSSSKKLPKCSNKVNFKGHFNNFKLVEVSCSGIKNWKIYVKTNLEDDKTKKSKLNKINTVIILNKSVEKGHYLTKNDLKFKKSFKKNIFYKNKDELIGRKLKQNLRQGQILQPRHLFKKYLVNEGEPVIIQSKFGKGSVSTGGIALKSGNIGDILEAKNIRSGKIIKGILKKNKKINVFF